MSHTTDAFFKEMIKAVESKARKNVRAELAALKKENAALQKKIAAFPALIKTTIAERRAERSKLDKEWDRFKAARSRLVKYSGQIDKIVTMSVKDFLNDPQPWMQMSRSKALAVLKKQEARVKK